MSLTSYLDIVLFLQRVKARGDLDALTFNAILAVLAKTHLSHEARVDAVVELLCSYGRRLN